MGDRVSRTILLCEDDPHAQLVRAYMDRCGLNTREPYLHPRVASREVHGGNVNWVIQEFPKELHACRQRHIAHANTMLIVVADADEFDVAVRRSHLMVLPPPAATDPLVILIPKRHIETWIRAALGEQVTEAEDCKKNRPVRKSEVREAARSIHGWARGNPQPSDTCVQSLRDALPDWRRIG